MSVDTAASIDAYYCEICTEVGAGETTYRESGFVLLLHSLERYIRQLFFAPSRMVYRTVCVTRIDAFAVPPRL